MVLPGAGSAGDQDIQAPLHHGREQLQHGLGQGFVLQHVASGDRIACQTPDGKAGTVDGKRRNDCIHAGAVGEPGIHHGRGFIHAPAYARDDAVDDLHQVLVVLEAQAGGLEFARPLDVYPVVAVHQNVGNRGILEQRLQRAEAENLVQNLPRQTLALGETEGHRFVVDGVANQQQNFFAGRFSRGAPQLLKIQAIQDLAVKIGLYLLVLGFLEALQIRHKSVYTVLNRDQVARFTSGSFSVKRAASPIKARAISV